MFSGKSGQYTAADLVAGCQNLPQISYIHTKMECFSIEKWLSFSRPLDKDGKYNMSKTSSNNWLNSTSYVVQRAAKKFCRSVM